MANVYLFSKYPFVRLATVEHEQSMLQLKSHSFLKIQYIEINLEINYLSIGSFLFFGTFERTLTAL